MIIPKFGRSLAFNVPSEILRACNERTEKLDKSTARIIKNWVLKNLVDTTDPRMHGKALTGTSREYGATGLEIIGSLLKSMMIS